MNGAALTDAGALTRRSSGPQSGALSIDTGQSTPDPLRNRHGEPPVRATSTPEASSRVSERVHPSGRAVPERVVLVKLSCGMAQVVDEFGAGRDDPEQVAI